MNEISCPRCHKVLRIPNHLEASEYRCPACIAIFNRDAVVALSSVNIEPHNRKLPRRPIDDVRERERVQRQLFAGGRRLARVVTGAEPIGDKALFSVSFQISFWIGLAACVFQCFREKTPDSLPWLVLSPVGGLFVGAATVTYREIWKALVDPQSWREWPYVGLGYAGFWLGACVFIATSLIAVQARGMIELKDFVLGYVVGVLVGFFVLISMLIFRMFLACGKDLPGMLARASEPDEPEMTALVFERDRVADLAPPRKIPRHLEDKIHEL